MKTAVFKVVPCWQLRNIMFGINDIPKFVLAFFLLLPVISIIHEGGHVFFAWLMGGKKIRVSIGTGKPLFRWGIIEVRKYYFWYGFCTFENVKRKERFANILIFSGGALFNLLGTIAVMLLVENGYLEAGIATYQFTYFSLYYVFFALLPMPYPDGNYSDGKIILDLIKGKEEVVKQRNYRVLQQGEGEEWHVFDENNELVEVFAKETDALEKAREVARKNRPSCVIHKKGGEEKEVHNFPKIPL